MGRKRDISTYQKGQVNAVKVEGYAQREIAGRLHISKWAVQNALRLGDSSGRKNCGPKRKTTIREDRLIKTLVVRSPHASSARVAHEARLPGCNIMLENCEATVM